MLIIGSVPHLIVEYSGNLAAVVDIDAALATIHTAAAEHGLPPLDGLRTRGEPRAHFVIADGHPSNAFVAVTARVGPGRPAEDKRSFVEALLQATQRAFANPVLDIAYSVELQEIDPEFRINVNEIRPKLAERTRRRAHTDP